MGEAYAGLTVFLAVAGKRDIAYHTEHFAAVAFVELNGLLVVAGKHYFGAAAHAQHLLMLVESLRGEEH